MHFMNPITNVQYVYRERQNELEQIQNKSRPVTSEGHRDNIGNFMAKNAALRENVNAAQASGKQNVPLNSADVEEHRPEAVVIEIQGVSQQQRVSSMLQTSGFRRQLENIIRGSFRAAGNNSPVNRSASASTASPVNRSSSASTASTPTRRQVMFTTFTIHSIQLIEHFSLISIRCNWLGMCLLSGTSSKTQLFLHAPSQCFGAECKDIN